MGDEAGGRLQVEGHVRMVIVDNQWPLIRSIWSAFARASAGCGGFMMLRRNMKC